MNKLPFFLAAMAAGECRRRAFIISAFSLIQEGPDDWRKEPYPYRLVQTPAGHFYVSPTDIDKLVLIPDAPAGAPPFHNRDIVNLKAGDVPNLKEDIQSTYGRLLFNFMVIVYAFGNKVDYVNVKHVKPGYLEDLIVNRVVDDQEVIEASTTLFAPQRPPRPDDIPMSEYLRFANAMFFAAAFTQLWVPGATEKSLLPPPGIKEYRAKLLEENKDRLYDPAVIAQIDAKLVAFDTAYLKGDLSEGYLTSHKSRNIVRKKLFLMHGAEVGLAERMDVELIPTSLSEGWDISKFPEMNNSLRAGSFNRGAQTMLGGESVKWLLRASSNIAVTAADCGSRLGNVKIITEEDKRRYYGLSVVTHNGNMRLSEENIEKYMNKRVMIRSPMYCKLPKTDYCAICCGDALSLNPTALSSAVSDYGSAFLSMYMAAAHAKALVVAHMDFTKELQ